MSQYDEQKKIAPDEREQVRWQNEAELGRLCQVYSLHIRTDQYKNWRPTVRSHGDIRGVWGSLEIIATDGILGYFLNSRAEGMDAEVYLGHISHFTGEVKTMFSITPPPKPKGERKKRVKSDMLERALKALAGFKRKT